MLIQKSAVSPVQVTLNFTFIPQTESLANLPRGLHIHTFGISEMSQDPSVMCESAGPHWNPTNQNHGSPNSANAHAGDLGNIRPVAGRIFVNIQSSKLSLFGVDSIVGRSIVIHEGLDDEGTGKTAASLKSGNSGRKIACGTIGLLKF